MGLAIENKDDSFIKTLLKNEKLDVNAYVYYKEKPYHIHVSNALQYASKYYTVDSEITKLLSNKMKNKVIQTTFILLFSLLILQSQLFAAGSQRIISLIPSSTEMLFAIGFGEEVIAVSNYCNYPSN